MSLKPLIGILEGEPGVSDEIQKYLKEMQFELCLFSGFNETSVKHVLKAFPALLIIDISSGGIKQATETAFAIKQKKNIPIVYLTCETDPLRIKETFETEPFGYIHKNVNFLQIYSTVNAALRQSITEKRLRESEKRYRTLIEEINDVIYSTDENLVIDFVSSRVESMLGYSPDEIIGRKFTDFLYEGDQHKLFDNLDRLKNGILNPIEYRVKHKNGSLVSARFSSRPVLSQGKLKGVTGVITDISDLKEAQRFLEFQSGLLDQIGDRITATDLEGKIAYVNYAETISLGMSKEEILGKTVHDFGDDPSRGATQAEIIRETLEKGSWSGEVVNRSSSGEDIFFETRTWLIKNETGEPAGFVGISRDITQEKKAGIAIFESEKRLARYIEESPIAIFIVDKTGKYIRVNHAAEKITGYSREELLSMNLEELSGIASQKIFTEYERSLLSAEGRLSLESEITNRRGERFIILVEAVKISDDEYIAFCSNITERKEAERLREIRLEEKQLMTEAADYLAAALSAEEIYSYLGNIMKRKSGADYILLSGYNENTNRLELVYQHGLENIMDFIVDTLDINPEDFSVDQDYLHKELFVESTRKGFSIFEGGVYDLTGRKTARDACLELEKKLGVKNIWHMGFEWEGRFYGGVFLVMCSTDKPYEGDLLESIVNHTSIVLRRRFVENSLRIKSEQLEESLQEKEILLKEIHHRVKNNMQVIISLLSLQAGRITDSDIARYFNESQNRIRAMALIHENLYQAGNLSKIALGKYIETVINELLVNYSISANKINLEIELDEVSIAIDQAIPCGLIVNELLSNCLKYAFPESFEGKPVLKVLLKVDDNNIGLSVIDNGTGLPEPVLSGETDSFGFTLLKLMANQLRAELSIKGDKGTEVNLVFKKNK